MKSLLKMSWRSLIIRAVADSADFFSDAFVEQAERCSPFRFDFLRQRQARITSEQGLYARLFEAFLDDDSARGQLAQNGFVVGDAVLFQ